MQEERRQTRGLPPAVLREIREAAEAAIRETIAAGAQPLPYRCGERAAGAPSPFLEAPEAPDARIARLTRALRAERRLGQAGSRAYDLNRHIALAQKLVAAKAGRLPPAAPEGEGHAGRPDEPARQASGTKKPRRA